MAAASGLATVPAATLIFGRSDGFQIRPEDICSSTPKPNRGLDTALAAEAAGTVPSDGEPRTQPDG